MNIRDFATLGYYILSGAAQGVKDFIDDSEIESQNDAYASQNEVYDKNLPQDSSMAAGNVKLYAEPKSVKSSKKKASYPPLYRNIERETYAAGQAPQIANDGDFMENAELVALERYAHENGIASVATNASLNKLAREAFSNEMRLAAANEIRIRQQGLRR